MSGLGPAPASGADGGRSRTVLLGDSHLARLGSGAALGDGVVNAAVGGASAYDLGLQAGAAALRRADVALVSVGTNDAAPWKQTPLADFRARLEELLGSVRVRRWVYVAPPGVREERLGGGPDRTNAVIATYRGCAADCFAAVAGSVVPAHLLVEGLGADGFVEDGVHLSQRGCDVLLPALRRAVATDS